MNLPFTLGNKLYVYDGSSSYKVMDDILFTQQ